MASLDAGAGQLPEALKCGNSRFAGGIGADLLLTLSDGKPVHGTLTLRDGGLFGGTRGEFNALPPTYNEDWTDVVYLSWYAGAGGADGHLELIPRKMVIYALETNYAHNQDLFLGDIRWRDGAKIETHFVFECAPTAKP